MGVDGAIQGRTLGRLGVDGSVEGRNLGWGGWGSPGKAMAGGVAWDS